jgi:hypothetical protein
MIGSIHIYEDIISKDKQGILEDYFSTKKIGWKHINNTEYIESYQPQDVMKPQSITDSYIKSIISEIEKNVANKLKTKVKSNYRFKVNLLKSEYFSKDRNPKDSIHIDIFYPHISMVYYINDSDGDTKFYKLKEGSSDNFIKYVSNKEYDRFQEFKSVSPKKGRVVVFDGLILHHSTYPKYGDRYVINFNTIIETEPNSVI